MPRIVDPLIAELEQEAVSTRKLLERVPADKLTWKPHAKSMSLGQLALHIATVPGGIAQMLQMDSFQVPEFVQAEAKTAAELVPTLDQSIATAKSVLDGFDDQRAMGMFRVIVGDKEVMAMPKAAVMRVIMLNHWYHHRGQLSVYLRELNVPIPSIYGPSADENPFQ